VSHSGTTQQTVGGPTFGLATHVRARPGRGRACPRDRTIRFRSHFSSVGAPTIGGKVTRPTRRDGERGPRRLARHVAVPVRGPGPVGRTCTVRCVVSLVAFGRPVASPDHGFLGDLKFIHHATTPSSHRSILSCQTERRARRARSCAINPARPNQRRRASCPPDMINGGPHRT
jgi:hypothetical protein